MSGEHQGAPGRTGEDKETQERQGKWGRVEKRERGWGAPESARESRRGYEQSREPRGERGRVKGQGRAGGSGDPGRARGPPRIRGQPPLPHTARAAPPVCPPERPGPLPNLAPAPLRRFPRSPAAAGTHRKILTADEPKNKRRPTAPRTRPAPTACSRPAQLRAQSDCVITSARPLPNASVPAPILQLWSAQARARPRFRLCAGAVPLPQQLAI